MKNAQWLIRFCPHAENPNTFTDLPGDRLNSRERSRAIIALESRVNDWQPHNGSIESAYHCRHCGSVLDGYGFHFTCHICGARYCYVHLRKHDRAHARTPPLETLTP
jgi:hypothetical protein